MIQRTFAISVFSLLMIVTSSCFAQDSLNYFTDNEVIKLDSMISWYEQNDSIQNQTIFLLDNQIVLYKQQEVLDSTLLFYTSQELFLLKERVDLYVKLNKEIKPKWYDKKGLWFFIGAGSMIGSSILLNNIQ